MLFVSTRKKLNQKRYDIYRNLKPNERCDFCKFDIENCEVIAEYDHFWIVENLFGYDIWDNMEVKEHLMIVPKCHTESISKLESNAITEYAKIIAKYDSQGYSFYARAAENESKSVPHQHTHLLKFCGKRKRLRLFVEKPYLLWFK